MICLVDKEYFDSVELDIYVQENKPSKGMVRYLDKPSGDYIVSELMSFIPKLIIARGKIKIDVPTYMYLKDHRCKVVMDSDIFKGKRDKNLVRLSFFVPLYNKEEVKNWILVTFKDVSEEAAQALSEKRWYSLTDLWDAIKHVRLGVTDYVEVLSGAGPNEFSVLYLQRDTTSLVVLTDAERQGRASEYLSVLKGYVSKLVSIRNLQAGGTSEEVICMELGITRFSRKLYFYLAKNNDVMGLVSLFGLLQATSRRQYGYAIFMNQTLKWIQ